MAYKTGGHKTKYIYDYGYEHKEYTIYCALESCSNICTYKMFNNETGKEVCITLDCEEDTDDFGNHSLIDCLFYLKHWGKIDNGKFYPNLRKDNYVKVEKMTSEEMTKIFER